MRIIRGIWNWLGISAPVQERNAAARRNMLVISFGSAMVALFAAMLSFCILTGTPCPVDGFDQAAYETPQATARFQVFCPIALVVLVGIFAYSVSYVRLGRCRPREALLVAMLFSLALVMLWGVVEAARSISSQLLIFASIQFLIAGLLIYSPMASLLYFALSFFLFGVMLDFSGYEATAEIRGQLAYLVVLDTAVSWIVYGLHRRSVLRERSIADLSRRDELTGAKNRHYLREDFSAYVDRPAFIMFCDIDDFKRYNDEFDHDVGDALLRAFYFALREAYGDECCYRYGGDEFLVISPDLGEEEFLAKSRKVVEQLKTVKAGGRTMPLTFSGGYFWGVASEEGDFRSMLHRADERLLKAKRAGKNRVVGGRAACGPDAGTAPPASAAG